MQHTEEEWWLTGNTIRNEANHIAYMNTYCDHTYATRIIACVNGCKGIKNPGAVGEVVEALKGCINVIEKQVPKHILQQYIIIPLENAKQALTHIEGITP